MKYKELEELFNTTNDELKIIINKKLYKCIEILEEDSNE